MKDSYLPKELLADFLIVLLSHFEFVEGFNPDVEMTSRDNMIALINTLQTWPDEEILNFLGEVWT